MPTKSELQTTINNLRAKLSQCQSARADDATLIAELRQQIEDCEDTEPSPTPEPEPEPEPLPIPSYLFHDSLNTIPADWHWQIAKPFTAKPTVEDGAARIETFDPHVSDAASYSRRVWDANGGDFAKQGEGDEIWFGGSWRIDNPAALKWTRLLAMASYESGSSSNWLLALLVRDGGDYRLAATDYGYKTPVELVTGIALPGLRLFRVDVHCRLSATDGQALTEVYLDGAKVGSSTKRNLWAAQPLTTYQGGLAYWWTQNRKQVVHFDDARFTVE